MQNRGDANLNNVADSTVLKVVIREGIVGLSFQERVDPGDSAAEGSVDRRRWDLNAEEVGVEACERICCGVSGI